MVKRLRIGLCLPFGIILENTPAWQSYWKLQTFDGWKIHHKIAFGSNIGENRNVVCRDIETDLKYQKIDAYDKILLIDYDVSFTQKDVEQIVNHNCDVVSGLVQLKDNLKNELYNKCHAGKWFENPGIINHRYSYDDTGMYLCDWVGAGFLCINKSIFEKIPYPWFIHQLIEVQKKKYTLRKETMEDIGFSLLCSKYDIGIYVDCDIKLKHHIFFSKERQYLDVIDDLKKQLDSK